MKKARLVKQLRHVMRTDVPHIPERRFSDAEVIDYFRICGGCGTKIISDSKLDSCIARCRSIHDWFRILDEEHNHMMPDGSVMGAVFFTE
jgi:hypothetical protein